MKNKKLLVIIGILLITILIIGALSLKPKKTTIEPKSIFSSVKDAITQNLTLSCEFTDEKGNLTKSYIKNGAVRVSMTGDDKQAGEIIIKDKKMYIWDTTTKEGFVYVIEDEAQDITGTSKSYLNMIDQYKDYCKVAAVTDSYFTVPTDVNFQDMSKFLQDLQNK